MPLDSQVFKLQSGKQPLRQALAQLNGELVVGHANHIELLRDEFDHQIDFVDIGPAFRCGAFALGVSGDPVFNRLNAQWQIELDRRFWKWLVESRLRTTRPFADGALAIYLNDRIWTHAGRVTGRKILSKWGTFPIYLHPVDEVPVTYGRDVLFCRMPSRDETLGWLLEYAQQNNVPTAVLNELRPTRSLRPRTRDAMGTP